MALPTTNITTMMVRNELGETSNNVSALCKSLNINMYSKYKPTRHTAPFTDNWFEGKIDNDYYSGATPYGIYKSYSGMFMPGTAPTVGMPVAPFAGVGMRELAKNAKWYYLPPRGNAYNEYYRLGDFRGYQHRQYDYEMSNANYPVRHWLSSAAITQEIIPSCTFRYQYHDYINQDGGIQL